MKYNVIASDKLNLGLLRYVLAGWLFGNTTLYVVKFSTSHPKCCRLREQESFISIWIFAAVDKYRYSTCAPISDSWILMDILMFSSFLTILQCSVCTVQYRLERWCDRCILDMEMEIWKSSSHDSYEEFDWYISHGIVMHNYRGRSRILYMTYLFAIETYDYQVRVKYWFSKLIIYWAISGALAECFFEYKSNFALWY